MKGKSCLIIAGIVLAVFVVAAVVLWQLYLTVPVIEEPNVRMPSPNAFDYYIKAGSQLKDVPRDMFADWLDLPSGKRDLVLKNNQTALRTLRKGLTYDYVHPLKYGIDAMYPEYRQFRDLARLLKMDAEFRARRGDWSGAMNSCLDGMLMGEGIPRDGQWTAKLLGVGLQNTCRQEAWPTVQRLDSLQARGAIARLEEIARHHLPIDESLEQVKTYELLGLQYHFSGRCKDQSIKDWPKLPRYIKAKAFRDYTAYMDECIANVRLPYASEPKFPELQQSKNRAIAKAYLPADYILSIMCSNCDTLWFRDVECQTQNRLLMTALALHAYKLETGDYPDRLSQLVPTYLTSLPHDPFALKGPLRYRSQGGSYVLWSVGPDAKNDGGKPIFDAAADKDSRYSTTQDSTGDIVAGVNK